MKYNKTTEELNHVYLEKDSSVYLECEKHKIKLKFKVFFGDSYYFFVKPCPKCIEEAKEIGRKEIKKK